MNILQQIFQRYRNKQSDAQERQLVDTWYEAAGRFPLPRIIGRKQLKHSEEKGWRAVALQLGFEQPDVPMNAPVRRLPVVLQYAAVLLLLAGGITGVSKWYRWQQDNRGSALWGDQRVWRTITAGTGQRKKLLLPDSSIVWLNNNSVIKLSEEAYRNGPNREIWLQEGEAYFEVAGNKKRPFVVYIDTLRTEVLGTAFSIQAYRSLDNTRIAVNSGSVQVVSPQGLLGVLQQQDLLTYDNSTGACKKTVQQNTSAGWWNGRFILDHARYDELLVRMKARYGVQLKTNNRRIRHTSFSAAFSDQASLEQVLEALCVIYKTSYTVLKANNTIIIH